MSDADRIHVDVLSLTWDEALLSFRLPDFSKVRVRALRPDPRPLAETTQQNAVGRIQLAGLQPGTEQVVCVERDGGQRDLTFSTLPAPQGPCRGAYLVFGDPHVALETENRKGRLFVEGPSILAEVVEMANTAAVDAVLIAGDITNSGTPQECVLARNILADLKCPWLCVPGDHDRALLRSGMWADTFGPVPWRRDVGPFRFLGVDTSGERLGAEGVAWLRDGLAGEPRRRTVVLSHLQLWPDEYIRSVKNKVVKDVEECRAALSAAFDASVLVYAGHQNVASRVGVGRGAQVNVPMPVQFPCGVLWAREYANGLYHTYRPIRSEALCARSRGDGERAVECFQEPQWRGTYRLGAGPDQWNFVFTP